MPRPRSRRGRAVRPHARFFGTPARAPAAPPMRISLRHLVKPPLAVIARNGLQFGNLSSTQLAAALTRAQAALSSDGYARLANIRGVDNFISSVSSMYEWGAEGEDVVRSGVSADFAGAGIGDDSLGPLRTVAARTSGQ